MTVIDKLATTLNRRDEVPNQELAAKIAATRDRRAVRELVDNLANTNRGIQSDCIKVLYEIGGRAPALIAPYHKEFGTLLGSKHKRLVWGAMTALDSIASLEPRSVYGLLAKVIQVADGESVIARDHAIGILIKLGSIKEFSKRCVPLLIEQLMGCPNNQFPMYAEKAAALLAVENRQRLVEILRKRIDGLEKESQKARITKVLRKVTTKE